MMNLLKDTHNSPSPWLNFVPSLEKLCHAVVARTEQANLQTPITVQGIKEHGVQVSLFYVTDILQNLKIFQKLF